MTGDVPTTAVPRNGRQEPARRGAEGEREKAERAERLFDESILKFREGHQCPAVASSLAQALIGALHPGHNAQELKGVRDDPQARNPEVLAEPEQHQLVDALT